jgi:hypothetical protein
MKNNHISQFSQFLRALARQQASWDGKHTTVIDRTILFTGANGTYCEALTAAEVGEVCKRYSEVVGCVDERQQHKPRE